MILEKIASGIDSLINRIGKATSWITVVLIVLICFDVIMRYLFNSTKTWIIELEWHLFAVLFLVGASYTLLSDEHVRVDVFYERFSGRQKNLVNILGILLFLIPWCAVVIFYGWGYTMNSYSFSEGSSQPNGLPARYIIKSFIVIGFFLLFLQGISLIIKAALNKE